MSGALQLRALILFFEVLILRDAAARPSGSDILHVITGLVPVIPIGRVQRFS
jgi:hypothetical protein